MVKRKINEDRVKEFKRIKQLTDKEVEPLIKLREDLEEAIKRVNRIHQAFTRELTKRAGLSNRVKHIIKQTEDIKFHTDCQLDIISKKTSAILNYKPVKKTPVKEESLCLCDL
jgi:hypothetical protein